MSNQQNGRHTGRNINWPERNTTIELAQILGTGGEGEVYSVRRHPELAVKIYHENRRPQGPMAEKLSAMEAITLDFAPAPATTIPRVAWPEKIIKLAKGQQVIGMVMPLVDRSRTDPISHFLTLTTRQISLPKHRVNHHDFDRIRPIVAQNIITAVKAIHKSNCVIGDVNDENILVDPSTGETSIVDCDAFQVTDYKNRTVHRCKVGREQFTAPELLQELSRTRCRSTNCRRGREEGPHRPDYSCLDRKPDHDMFGIGVILFKLFMNGAHPYNQKTDPASSKNSTLKDLISSRQYPYQKHAPTGRVAPLNQKLYNQMPDNLKDLFFRTFA